MSSPSKSPRVLDLERFRGSRENRVLAGRDEGKQARLDARVDELDTVEDSVKVLVPHDLFSVTSSFFLGLFEESIRRLGGTRFLEHYAFSGKPIQRVIDDAIRSAELTSPLRSKR